MNGTEPRRIWRIVETLIIDGERRYLFDNHAPIGPHYYLAPVEWFWGKAGVR